MEGAGYVDDEYASWMAEHPPPLFASLEAGRRLGQMIRLDFQFQLRETETSTAILFREVIRHNDYYFGVAGAALWEDWVTVIGGDTGVGDDDAYRDGGFGAVPASGDAIAGLPEATVGETREEECAVCLEDFEAGDKLRKMPCSHGFHESCIFGWLRVSRLCPCCRFALPADEVSEMEIEQ